MKTQLLELAWGPPTREHCSAHANPLGSSLHVLGAWILLRKKTPGCVGNKALLLQENGRALPYGGFEVIRRLQLSCNHWERF